MSVASTVAPMFCSTLETARTIGYVDWRDGAGKVKICSGYLFSGLECVRTRTLPARRAGGWRPMRRGWPLQDLSRIY